MLSLLASLVFRMRPFSIKSVSVVGTQLRFEKIRERRPKSTRLELFSRAGEQDEKMTDGGDVVTWPRPEPRVKGEHFDWISITLHWLTAALVATQLTTAWLMSQGGDYSRVLLSTHRSIGVLTWTVVVARLVWRRSFAYLPPFPAGMPKLRQWVAKIVEYGLYILLLIQPITGLGNTLFHGRPFALFAWWVPALLAPNKTVFRTLQTVHELGAMALLTLIGLHAAAALFHGVVLRDGILQRMLPWRTRQSRKSAASDAVG
jgi:cytochrome b561